jgi:hypothetical protein
LGCAGEWLQKEQCTNSSVDCSNSQQKKEENERNSGEKEEDEHWGDVSVYMGKMDWPYSKLMALGKFLIKIPIYC